MADEEINRTLIEIYERISKCENEIKNIETKVDLLASDKSGEDDLSRLAIENTELKETVKGLEMRLSNIESEKRQKNYGIWQIVMSAILGGILTTMLSLVMGA